MGTFNENSSRHIELLGHVCNWVVGSIATTTIVMLMSDELFDDEIGCYLLIFALFLSFVYLIFVIYRHLNRTKYESFSDDKSYSLIRFQSTICVVIVIIFLLTILWSYFEYFLEY